MQAQREVQFESDGCALLEHPMAWRSGIFVCELKILASTEIQGSYVGLYFMDEPTEPTQRSPSPLLSGYPGCNGASWGWAGTGAHRANPSPNPYPNPNPNPNPKPNPNP